MPEEVNKVFTKPLREFLRDGLRGIFEQIWPDLARNIELQNEPLRALPKEFRAKFLSFVRDTVLRVGVDLAVDEVGPYLDSLQDSLERTGKLVLEAATMRNGTGEDALRASVVLLHASLEDFLRTIAANLLPKAKEEALNEIPLVGLKGRPKNFGLGRLVQHRGKTVDDVLRESISEHLERSNFNSTTDIATHLQWLGFTVADHNSNFPVLEQMIQRRHQIVHRADKVKALDSEIYVLQQIKPEDVHRWAVAVSMFIGSILPRLAQRMLTPERLEPAIKDVLLREAKRKVSPIAPSGSNAPETEST